MSRPSRWRPETCGWSPTRVMSQSGSRRVINRGDAVELDGLFVAPEWMRRGIGGALVADVVARARAAGARRIEVTANPGAVPFYGRHGFRQTGATETRFGPENRRAPLRMSASCCTR